MGKFAGNLEQHIRNIHQLFEMTRAELEICARHIPGVDEAVDQGILKQEYLLSQIQSEIFIYISNLHIQTIQQARCLADFWRVVVDYMGGDTAEITHQLAENLINFYQDQA